MAGRARRGMTVLTNARVHTLDERGTVADTLVVRDGRVAFVGRRSDVSAAVGEPTLDLGGRAVLPGLVDAHGHLDVPGARAHDARRGRRDVGRGHRARAWRRPPPWRRRGEWISGRGWDQNLWPGAALSRPRLARSRGAAESRGARPRRRPRHLGQLGGAPRSRDHARHRGSDGRHRRQGRRRRAHRLC